MRLSFYHLGIVCAALLCVACTNGGKKAVAVSLETATASIRTISTTITATGTVQPVDQVEIGTQVSGVVQQVFVDYNALVRKGQVLARLDITSLSIAVETASSVLRSAEIDYEFQKKNLQRIEQLAAQDLISPEEFDNIRHAVDNADAARERATAELKRSRTNLGYATIVSPIDGIVLARAVQAGQTVAASFNTPTLFTIARDLTRMEVQASIDEADIGTVRNGQDVTFSVDAFPGETFSGTVSQIRLKPVVTANVVTYTTIITAPNPQQRLMPGMTATVAIITGKATDALTVPVAALRFHPDPSLLAAYRKSRGIAKNPAPSDTKQHPATAPDSPRSVGRKQPQTAAGTKPDRMSDGQRDDGTGAMATFWMVRGSDVIRLQAGRGLDNGVYVVIESGLAAGDTVAVSLTDSRRTDSKKNQAAPSSPFMPRRPGTRSR